MVLPIADDNSDRTTTPVVNYSLIFANVFVFVVLQSFGNNDRFTYAFSTLPAKIWTAENYDACPNRRAAACGTSMGTKYFSGYR